MIKLKFEDLPLSEPVRRAVTDLSFEEASPIQSASIPILLQGRDLVGQAQTGTGKTAAFAIPVIENIDGAVKQLQAIVLCPTRELVIQVTEEFRKLMKYREDLSVVPVYGGQEIERQFRALKKNPQIIVGTPGRLMDHLSRGSIRMHSVRIAVLDEADEMLDMGFRDDIQIILGDTPPERQTVMFSATMSEDIFQLTRRFQRDPVRIDVSNQKINAPKIQQVYFEVQEKVKPEALARLIDLHAIKLALVFCNTKSQVDALVEVLKSRGYFAEGLHGDLNQRQRDKVMKGFRSGTVEILVATDVAGRGIDVNDIEAVFNYDLPRDDEDYVHRIGRTGRAGKSGIAFTFVVGKQVYHLKRIERLNGVVIERRQVPTMDDLEETRLKAYKERVRSIFQEGHLAKYINYIETMMEDDMTAMDVAAALFKITLDHKSESFDANLVIPDVPKYDGGDGTRSRKPGYRGRKYADRKKPAAGKKGGGKYYAGFGKGDKGKKKKAKYTKP